MINTIHASGLVMVQQSPKYHGSIPVPPSAVPGTVWHDGQRMKVYTGSSWQDVGDDVHVFGSIELQNVVFWARKKMSEEEREAELQEKFPALKQAKDNYDLIRKLVAE